MFICFKINCAICRVSDSKKKRNIDSSLDEEDYRALGHNKKNQKIIPYQGLYFAILIMLYHANLVPFHLFIIIFYPWWMLVQGLLQSLYLGLTQQNFKLIFRIEMFLITTNICEELEKYSNTFHVWTMCNIQPSEYSKMLILTFLTSTTWHKYEIVMLLLLFLP